MKASSEVRFHLKSVPIQRDGKVPIDELVHTPHYRKRISKKRVEQIAIEKYRKYGKGIDFTDVIREGPSSKEKSQRILKDCCRERMDKSGELHKPILFRAPTRTSPQQFFPNCMHADIIEDLKKRGNVPIHPTGVALPNLLPISKGPLANCLEPVIMQTLEGYVLPLLPEAPLFIHNMHFKTKVSPECYAELNLPYYKKNKGKYHTEIIGSTHVDYVFYSSGTVNINTTCSKNPYKLETEEDRSRIISFFGQIRDRLIILLADKHERLVPDIMDWQLTEADINKDIKVSDVFHFSAIKVQVRHLDHLFSVYVKSMGEHTVCRLEERKHPAEKPAIEFVNDIFNPIGRLEKQIAEIEKKVDVMLA